MKKKDVILEDDYKYNKDLLGSKIAAFMKDSMSVIVSVLIVIGAVTAFAATKANQADLEALQKTHADDTKETRELIIYLQIEDYTEQIHMLENKKNPTIQDKSNANYLKSRQDNLKLKFQKSQ